MSGVEIRQRPTLKDRGVARKGKRVGDGPPLCIGLAEWPTPLYRAS